MEPIELRAGPLVCAFCMVWGQSAPRPLCPDHAKYVAKAMDDHPGYDLQYDTKTNKFYLLPRTIASLPSSPGSKDGQMGKIGDLDPEGTWFSDHHPVDTNHPGMLSTKDMIRAVKVKGRLQDTKLKMLKLMTELED